MRRPSLERVMKSGKGPVVSSSVRVGEEAMEVERTAGETSILSMLRRLGTSGAKKVVVCGGCWVVRVCVVYCYPQPFAMTSKKYSVHAGHMSVAKMSVLCDSPQRVQVA